MKLQSILRAAFASAALTTLALPLGAVAAPTAMSHASSSGPKIKITTTAGVITAVLDPKHAPVSTANFLKYVDSKFFNGGTFFRAIPGFVIQGGNKVKETTQDLPPIALEDPKTTHLFNVEGALAMARTSDPNSATSEFFIDDATRTDLDGPNGQPGYAVFGHVLTGMSVVHKIVNLPASEEMLTTPVTIIKIERIR